MITVQEPGTGGSRIKGKARWLRAELAVDRAQMRAHGGRGDEQALGDLPIALTS
jgi:hypothetical protein